MAGAKDRIQKVKAFSSDVIAEMKKCTWPERQELVESTIVVIVSVCLLSAFVGICDKVLITVLRVLFPV